MRNYIIVRKYSCQWCCVSFYSRHQIERDSDHKMVLFSNTKKARYGTIIELKKYLNALFVFFTYLTFCCRLILLLKFRSCLGGDVWPQAFWKEISQVSGLNSNTRILSLLSFVLLKRIFLRQLRFSLLRVWIFIRSFWGYKQNYSYHKTTR